MKGVRPDMKEEIDGGACLQNAKLLSFMQNRNTPFDVSRIVQSRRD